MKSARTLLNVLSENRFKKLRQVLDDTKMKTGWIRYIRHLMLLTINDLAQATNLSAATIQQMEKRETRGKITLETLNKIAEQLNCDLMYAFVPKENIESFLEKKAIEKATRLVRNADVHMMLEDQRVKEKIESRIARLAKELLAQGDIW